MATRIFPSGPPHIVNATVKHTATVIFLHGLGDSGTGWLQVVQMIKKDLPHIKWVLPNAPTRSITANFGMMMPGWFDITSFDWKVKEDREGLLESARTIDKHIQDEVDGGIPTERIVLGGFSQGGTMSLLTGFTARENGQFGGRTGWRLGGIAVLSGWLPLRDTFSKIASPHLAKTPVFICHGTADPLVPYSLAQKTKEVLTGALGLRALDDPVDLGAQGLSFRPYEGVGHEASTQTLTDLTTFLNRALPQVTS